MVCFRPPRRDAERIPELDVAFDAEAVLGDIIIFAAGATVPAIYEGPCRVSSWRPRTFPFFDSMPKSSGSTGTARRSFWW